MASVHRDTKSPNFSIRFRFEGRQINRSLGTPDERTASGMCARVDETLRLLEGGRIVVPRGVNAVEFILSDGRAPESKVASAVLLGLTELYATYRQRLPEGRKEPTTLQGEAIHLKHLKRLLGPRRTAQAISKADLQSYVSKRLNETHRGAAIQPDTVRKELVTFRMLWNWAVQEGLLEGPSPTRHVALPLTDEKPPFMTTREVRAIIARGGLTAPQERGLWSTVYLDAGEVSEALEHARVAARYPFVYPMLVFVAHTAARRTEMVRSLIEDIDFRSRTVVIREKKKSRTKAMTYRRVDMSPLLFAVMQEWVADHPGGRHTFCQPRGFPIVSPLTVWQAQHHLKQTMAQSKWAFITGFHVFRHSFASNLAAAGVDQRIIDEFMGHQTEEMRRRYRHLFPVQRRAAIEAVFGTRVGDKTNAVAS